jgi:tetratricopeptide (TPR) repeat protein
MKTKLLCFSSVIFTIILLSACSASKLMFATIDVLRPAEVAFSGDANRLLLVNNTVPQPELYGHTTHLLDGNKTPAKVKTDSLSLFLLSALNEELLNKEFFAGNELIFNSVNESTKFATFAPLSNDELQSLSVMCNADVVLALNHLETSDALTESVIDDGYSGEYILGLDVVYDTWWSIQYPNGDKQAQILHYQDTVYWESSNTSRRMLLRNFPERYDALVDGSLYVGQKMINRLVPYWEEVDRYLFEINKPLMQQGIEEIYKKNWEGAIPVWETALSQTGKKKQKALIQTNLAVAYEISGDLDHALKLITQAIDNYNSATANRQNLNTMLDYKDALLTRLKQQILIKEQIAN